MRGSLQNVCLVLYDFDTNENRGIWGYLEVRALELIVYFQVLPPKYLESLRSNIRTFVSCKPNLSLVIDLIIESWEIVEEGLGIELTNRPALIDTNGSVLQPVDVALYEKKSIDGREAAVSENGSKLADLRYTQTLPVNAQYGFGNHVVEFGQKNDVNTRSKYWWLSCNVQSRKLAGRQFALRSSLMRIECANFFNDIRGPV